MINKIKKLEIESVKFQLEKAALKKNKLIKNIYKEYLLYLQIVRDLLFTSVEKGINGVYCYTSIDDDFPTSNELDSFFENKVKNLIGSKLPLITVEQLRIIDSHNYMCEEINFDFFKNFSQTMKSQKNNFDFEDESVNGETFQFHINCNLSNSFEYYETFNNENLLSIDFDSKDHLSNSKENHSLEKIGFENKFVTSLLEIIDEDNISNPLNFENLYSNKKNDSLYHDLKSFDLIDKSLDDLLLNLSYKINLELFKSKFIKKIFSEETFKYLSNKNFIIKHPYPFAINFDLNTKQTLKYSSKKSNICFLCISTIELEFKNLNLSMHRNKINELKNLFQVLIKKERYWRQKEINLNKILK